MSDILEDIVAARKRRLDDAKQKVSLRDLEEKVKKNPAPFGFFAAVHQPDRIALIAEMKRQSPSGGLLRKDYDPAVLARAYEKGGASALSVLTEQDNFAGQLEDVAKARAACTLPILRKDFIFDPYQIVEARAVRADAVLLIAEMLSAEQLKELVACAKQVHVEPLVEVFTPASLPAALNSGARLIGINTRNLRTLEMHPDNVARLAALIPKDRAVVAESGIKTVRDVEALKGLRVSAILVGESLLKQDNIENAVGMLAAAGKK